MKSIQLFIVLALLCSGPAANAQVFIEQGKVNLTAAPGQTLSGEVTISNTSDKELKVKVYWEDFEYKPPFDGTKKFVPAGTSATSLAQWIQFSPRDAVLAPYGKQKIGYTIDVPQDIKSGGYYGVIFVEPETELSRVEKGVKIITRVGCLFFVETQDSVKQASIEDIAFNGSHLTGRIVNKGNVILIPQTTYYIMDRESIVADRGELKPMYIPPEQAFAVDLELNPAVAPGDYTIVLTLDLQDGNVVVKEADFTKNSDSDYVIKTVRD